MKNYIIAIFLFISNIIYSQTIFFNVSEIFFVENDRFQGNDIRFYNGMLKYDLDKNIAIYDSDIKRFEFKIIRVIDAEMTSKVLYCENDYNITIFEDKFVIRKLFRDNKGYIHLEERFYTITKNL